MRMQGGHAFGRSTRDVCFVAALRVGFARLVAGCPKRVDPNDQCLAAPCWDYNTQGQVVIIGKGCTDLGNAATAKVDIVVGCGTIHQ